MKLEIIEVIKLTLAISTVLFLTGLAVVPFVNNLTGEPTQQNIMYAIGRVPVVFAVIFVYLNMGEKDATTSK